MRFEAVTTESTTLSLMICMTSRLLITTAQSPIHCITRAYLSYSYLTLYDLQQSLKSNWRIQQVWSQGKCCSISSSTEAATHGRQDYAMPCMFKDCLRSATLDAMHNACLPSLPDIHPNVANPRANLWNTGVSNMQDAMILNISNSRHLQGFLIGHFAQMTLQETGFLCMKWPLFYSHLRSIDIRSYTKVPL